MAQAFVGKWQGRPNEIVGNFAEFVAAVDGDPGVLEAFNHPFIIDVTLEGGNRLAQNSVLQSKPTPIKWQTVTVIGEKTEDQIPGLGVLKVDCIMEGGKIVSTADHKGKPLIKEVYIEDGEMKNLSKFGDISIVIPFTKM